MMMMMMIQISVTSMMQALIRTSRSVPPTLRDSRFSADRSTDWAGTCFPLLLVAQRTVHRHPPTSRHLAVGGGAGLAATLAASEAWHLLLKPLSFSVKSGVRNWQKMARRQSENDVRWRSESVILWSGNWDKLFVVSVRSAGERLRFVNNPGKRDRTRRVNTVTLEKHQRELQFRLFLGQFSELQSDL